MFETIVVIDATAGYRTLFRLCTGSGRRAIAGCAGMGRGTTNGYCGGAGLGGSTRSGIRPKRRRHSTATECECHTRHLAIAPNQTWAVPVRAVTNPDASSVSHRSVPHIVVRFSDDRMRDAGDRPTQFGLRAADDSLRSMTNPWSGIGYDRPDGSLHQRGRQSALSTLVTNAAPITINLDRLLRAPSA